MLFLGSGSSFSHDPRKFQPHLSARYSCHKIKYKIIPQKLNFVRARISRKLCPRKLLVSNNCCVIKYSSVCSRVGSYYSVRGLLLII